MAASLLRLPAWKSIAQYKVDRWKTGDSAGKFGFYKRGFTRAICERTVNTPVSKVRGDICPLSLDTRSIFKRFPGARWLHLRRVWECHARLDLTRATDDLSTRSCHESNSFICICVMVHQWSSARAVFDVVNSPPPGLFPQRMGTGQSKLAFSDLRSSQVKCPHFGQKSSLCVLIFIIIFLKVRYRYIDELVLLITQLTLQGIWCLLTC